MHLEVGGGTNRRAGYVNLDPVHGDEGLRCRVQDGIPLPDDSVDGAYASHILEHIPAGDERIKAMNEVHRVLKPGAQFEIIVPLVGYTMGDTCTMVNGWWAWADPCHLSYWYFPESLLYFCDSIFKAHADYHISYWGPLAPDEWEVRNGWEGWAILTKPVELAE